MKRYHPPDEKEFQAWVDQQDAEQEERLRTPTHNGRPEEDWDKYEKHLPKGTKK